MTRKNFITLLVVLISTLSINTTFAQEQEDLSLYSVGKLKKLGKKAYYASNYYSAIRYYEEFSKQKEDYRIMYNLAECYRLTRNYNFAKYWYDKAYKENAKKNTKALYYYAKMLQTNQEYEEAKPLFRQFGKEYVGYKDSPIFSKVAKYSFIACDTAPGYIKAPGEARINPLNETINTVDLEKRPIFLNPTNMIYASSLFDTLDVDPKSDSVIIPAYYAAQKKGKEWESAGSFMLQEEDNPLQYAQDGAFSPDFQRFYFIKCEKGKKGAKLCQLWQSKKVYGVWQPAEMLPEEINSKGVSNTYVAVGNESKKKDEVVYFVSDREGGKGGLDVWYTIYQAKKQTWRIPKNAGNKINSQGDEITPYYDMATRTMYFSSNGWPGLGEYDIFKSTGELGRFTPKENMGSPVNTPYDDYYFTISENGQKGFLISNREGTTTASHTFAGDDIYEVDFVPLLDIPVAGKVFEVEDKELDAILDKTFDKNSGIAPKESDSISIEYIQGSTVSLYLGNTNEKVFVSSTETDENGDYTFTVNPDQEYVLQFENIKTGSALIPFSTYGVTTTDTIWIEDYGINYIAKDEMFTIQHDADSDEAPVFYEYGKWKLTSTQKDNLEGTVLKLLKEASEIVLEIRSHTDNHGSRNFNLKLSKKRADDIVKFLVRNGIEKERLIPKGFGFDMPLAPNNNPDGSDNPNGRRLNRRTEFKIIGTLNNVGGNE